MATESPCSLPSTIQVKVLKQMGIRVIGCTPDHGERSHGGAVRHTPSVLLVGSAWPRPTPGAIRA